MTGRLYSIKAGKITTWRCQGEGTGCGHRGYRDDDVKAAVADMMGLAQFDEAAFRSQIDHLSVSPAFVMTAHFKDGHTTTHQFSEKVKQPRWTAEHRAHFMEAVQRRKEAKLNANSQDNSSND